MKKFRSIVSLGLVLAMAMSVAACNSSGDKGGTYETPKMDYESETETETEATKPTVDPWGQIYVADEIVGATAIADKLLNMSYEEAVYSDELGEFFDGSASFSGDNARTVMIPETGYKIEGNELKCVYVWKDKAKGSLAKITFSARNLEYVPSTEAEAKIASDDMNYEAETAFTKVTSKLEAAFGGDYTTADTSALKASKSECRVWQHNGRDIAVTYAVDCYGITGNNEFKIDVYPTGGGGSSLAPEDESFRQMLSKIESCLGQDKDTVKAVLEEQLGLELKDEHKDKEICYYYYYSADFSIAGVPFNMIELHANIGDGKVFEVCFRKDTSKRAEIDGYEDTFKKKLSASFSDRFIPTNSRAYEGEFCTLGKGTYCIVSDYYLDDMNNFFYVIINAEYLREK